MSVIQIGPAAGAAWARRQWIAGAIWVAAAAAVLALAAPASAVTVVDTYTGTILTAAQIADFYPGNHNSDFTGIFGAASETGADISGQTFKAVVTTNIALAPETVTDPGTGDVDEVYAPAANSAAFSTVALTINGVTVDWTENQAGARVSESGAFQEAILGYALSGPGFMMTTDLFQIQVSGRPINSYDFPSNLGAPGTYSVGLSGGLTSIFTIAVTGVDTLVDTTGYLDPKGLTVSVSSAPEPSTWAMTLLGVSLLGGAQRRRRGRDAAMA